MHIFQPRSMIFTHSQGWVEFFSGHRTWDLVKSVSLRLQVNYHTSIFQFVTLLDLLVQMYFSLDNFGSPAFFTLSFIFFNNFSIPSLIPPTSHALIFLRVLLSFILWMTKLKLKENFLKPTQLISGRSGILIWIYLIPKLYYHSFILPL